MNLTLLSTEAFAISFISLLVEASITIILFLCRAFFSISCFMTSNPFRTLSRGIKPTLYLLCAFTISVILEVFTGEVGSFITSVFSRGTPLTNKRSPMLTRPESGKEATTIAVISWPRLSIILSIS